MSKEFYNYISSLIINFFNKEGIKPGDRFYLRLDSEEEVNELVNALSIQENVESFKYKHNFGDEYETFTLNVNSLRIIVAYTSSNVTPDYLVTLRNLVGEQKNEFRNTALLSIVSERLDSIEGGSSDLQKEGMPLHPNSIFINLEKEIDESNLKSHEKVVLKDHLEYLLVQNPYQQITFFDFKNIFSTLQKGFIDDHDYFDFGLFKDYDLDTFPRKEQKERLKQNREFLEFVKTVHDYGYDETELQKMFSESGAKKLIKEDWKTLSYSKVNEYHQEFIEENKEIKISLEEINLKEELTMWEKLLNESTAPGRRKRHIIIFNPNKLPTINLTAIFNLTGKISKLEEKYIEFGKQSAKYLDINARKNKLNISINDTNNICFVKFQYKHFDKVTLGAEIYIAVLPIEPKYIEEYKSRYLVNIKNTAIELKYDDESIKFGDGLNKKEIELTKFEQEIKIDDNSMLKLTPVPEAFNDEDQLIFYLNISENKIPFLLTNELPNSTPISGQRIWKLIRERQESMIWNVDNDRLLMGNQEYYLHPEYKQFFEWENSFISNGIKYADFASDSLEAIDIDLNDDLRESYNRYITYFQSKKNSIPSLCTITPDYYERAVEYLEEFLKEIKSFSSGSPAGKKGIDLFKLGTVKTQNQIYLTPFHPLMVAYKLKYFELLGKEKLDYNILNRLSPEALVPFIYDENNILYKPEYNHNIPQWLIYKPVNEISISDTGKYIAKIVTDKIIQFQNHFSYLFLANSKAPFKINVINIANDIEIIKGIFKWMISLLDKKSNKLKPVEITLYKENGNNSSLDIFSKIETPKEFEHVFSGIKLKAKGMDSEDVLRMLRENISFYKGSINDPYRYAHLTFYKMEEMEKIAIQQMDKMKTGITIEGIYSSVPSMKDEETYLSGFGTKAYKITEDNMLTSIAFYLNELAANLGNAGLNDYRKNVGIFSRTTNTDKLMLKNILDSSHWVTFIDPIIDLDFFNQLDDNLIVIHYSDQYSSSSRYDAITVTNKSRQYFSVIKEFLEQKELEGTNENVNNTIKAFNTFNGEWLLRIIGSKGQSEREKLSIISAIKFAVSYLDHPNILWVPISLEEILRVAGAANLNKSEGVFSAKNLGVQGIHSDDLLLIGLEKISDDILLYFYPVEVKIGINASSVLDKGRTQVLKTKRLILESLIGENKDTFKNKFYRNFFAQLFIANAHKLHENNFWKEKNYNLSDEIIEKLLKDDYVISNKLKDYIGEGAILSFQKDAFHRSAHIDNNVLLLNLIEYDGFRGLIQPVNEMRDWIQDKPNDFIKEDMLSYKYKDENKPDVYTEDTQNKDDEQLVQQVLTNRQEPSIIENNSTQKFSTQEGIRVMDESNLNKQNEFEKRSIENVRLLLGTAENSTRKIYWEYGHRQLANRHLLISGKSGQGKTYFMQCLLLEASKQGIPSIVVDYTEGFLPNQLEPEFVEYLGEKITQKIVYNEKFPINPFTKSTRDIGGIELLETEADVAERIKSVFSAVYDKLGIQQQNAIYEATKRGLKRYGNQMNLEKLREMLEEDNSNYAKTALSQIRTLIDRNPFDTDNKMNWKDIIKSDGEIFIIQLTGFNRDVQLIITEFILWDLWNYSVRNGNKNIPIPVIMDEAQNLDHRENSPSARILTEGRKFGWSAWYATQFLKAQLDADEIARLQMASQKIYFLPPEEEISQVASNLAKGAQERKLWEKKLSKLKKGQCIVQGPVLLENGELSSQAIHVVNITPLNERI